MKNSEVTNTAVNNKGEKANANFKSNGVTTSVKPNEDQKVNPVKEENMKPVVNSEPSKDKNDTVQQPTIEKVNETPSSIQQANESIPEPKTEKFAPNLDTTLKTIQELHRKAVQRKNLIGMIDNLQSFEIDLIDNADETATNYYTGCQLTIQDDKGKTFVIKHPTIIKTTAEVISALCTEKLAELEAVIVFPA